MRRKIIGLRKCCILLVFCVLCCLMPVDGSFYGGEDKLLHHKEHRNNVNDTLLYLGYDEDDRIYSVEYRSDSDANAMQIAFLYEEDRMIGEYIVEQNGNETYECFIVDDSETLLNMIKSEESISMVENDNGVVLMTDEHKHVVRNKQNEKFPIDGECENNDLVLTPENKEFTKISSASAVYLVGTAKTGYITAVEHVNNETSPLTEKGLCWSASGASFINYLQNKSYDTLTLYQYVRQATDINACGLPKYEKAMFDLHDLDYNYLEGKLHYYAVMGSLSNDSPIMWCVRRPVTTSEGTTHLGHAIVQCGVFNISDSYGYIYMDPNVEGGYVINYLDYSMITDTSNSTFYYYGGFDRLYDEVMRCYYNFR